MRRTVSLRGGMTLGRATGRSSFCGGVAPEGCDAARAGFDATADSKTEQDIKEQLTLAAKPIEVLRAGMDRPNISLNVLPLKKLSASCWRASS